VRWYTIAFGLVPVHIGAASFLFRSGLCFFLGGLCFCVWSARDVVFGWRLLSWVVFDRFGFCSAISSAGQRAERGVASSVPLVIVYILEGSMTN
jgi:hypothetical protein